MATVARIALLFTALVFASVLHGCFWSSKVTTLSASERPIRMALSPYQDTLIPMLGEIKGWYRQQGLNVEIKIMAMSEIQEALASGAIDVAVNNIASVISTHAKNPDCVYAYGFNTFDEGYALIIRSDGRLKPLNHFLKNFPTRQQAVSACAAQLKGKTIVTTSRTDMEQAAYEVVKRGGLDFAKDVKIRDFNPDEGLAAFLTGTGDAYLGGIPQRTRANKEGMREMLTGTDIGAPEINGFVTTRAFAVQRRKELLKLLRVWFQCVDYVDLHTDESASIIVAKLNSLSGAKFTVADFKHFWNNIEHYPANPADVENAILKPGGKAYWRSRWDDCNQYFASVTKSIPAPVDSNGVFIMPDIQSAYTSKYGSK